MSPKCSSLAFDETQKEFDCIHQINDAFEPKLEVIVNMHYVKPSLSQLSNDIAQIKGCITISF